MKEEWEEDFSAEEMQEIQDGVVMCRKGVNGAPKWLDLLKAPIAGSTAKPYTVYIGSVNANGLRKVPEIDAAGTATGRVRNKTALLLSIATKWELDVVMWQEGHMYDLSTDPVLYQYRSYSCLLGQAGITVLNKDFIVSEMRLKEITS